MPDLLTCRSHRASVSSLRTTFNKSCLWVLELLGWLCSPYRDRLLMPGGRMGDQIWAPFPVCWLGDVPGCAVAVWCEVEQPQSVFDPVLRLGHKHSTWECPAESGTSYMSCVSQSSAEWKCSMLCPSAGIMQGSDWSLWAKGDLSYNSPSSHRSHLGHEGMGVQTQPQSHAPSGDKNYVLSFTGMVLIVRTPRGKTEHLNSSHSAVGCCYPLFVQQLRRPLPSCMVGTESWE